MTLFIDATTLVIEHCETLEQLEQVGKRLAKEQMTDGEREALRAVYARQQETIRIFTGGETTEENE